MSKALYVDISKLSKAMKAFTFQTTDAAAREMKIQARNLCVRLAENTQPYGFTDAAKQQGEGAILKDLTPPRGIMKPLNKDWFAQAKQAQKLDPKAFERKFRNKEGKTWLFESDQILSNQSQIKAFHQSMRTKAGRRRTSQAGTFDRFIGRTVAGNRGVVEQGMLDKYIKNVQKKVGIAKAGWAACAQYLGTTVSNGGRGFPPWVKRQIGKYAQGFVEDQSFRKNKPYVEVTNLVPWIKQVISQKTIDTAVKFQIFRMIKRLNIIAEAEAKKAGFSNG